MNYDILTQKSKHIDQNVFQIPKHTSGSDKIMSSKTLKSKKTNLNLLDEKISQKSHADFRLSQRKIIHKFEGLQPFWREWRTFLISWNVSNEFLREKNQN